MNSTEMKVRQRIDKLQKLIKEKEQSLKHAPSGSLRIQRKNGHVYYYHLDPSRQEKPVYLGRDKKDLAQVLAQKSYDKQVLAAAQKELTALTAALSMVPEVCAEDIFPLLSPDRQDLVDPIALPDSVFFERWLQTPYTPKPFSDDFNEFYTENGERVRSKSEILIANTLKALHIPYKYECPLILKTGAVIHPDFTLLDMSHRRQLYLEHLGMMDDSLYSEAAMNRIQMYEQNGIYPGDSLILSYESKRCPLNVSHLKVKLNHYLGKIR